MKRRPWTPDDDVQLARLYPDQLTADIARTIERTTSAVYGRAAKLGLKKSAAFHASGAACRMNGHNPRSVATRFQPGQVPPNKGLRRPGWAPGRMRETQFTKGNLPHTTVPIGTEVVRKGGYVWVKKWDDRAPARYNWISKHQDIYEATHGPIPKGHIVRFKNGDRTNFALENLECVSRKEHAATKGLHSLPPEIVKVHQLRGAIHRQINKLRPPKPVRRGRPPQSAQATR